MCGELRPGRLKMATQTLVGSTYFLAGRHPAVQLDFGSEVVCSPTLGHKGRLTFIVLEIVYVLPGKNVLNAVR